MRQLLFLLVLLVTNIGSAQQKPAIYNDSVLQFEYIFPAEFHLTPQVADAMMSDTRDRVPEKLKETVHCVVTPFAAEHAEPLGGMELLVITRVDVPCIRRTTNVTIDQQYLDEIATGSIHEGLSRFPSPAFSSPTAFRLGSHPASFIWGSGSNGPARSGYSGVVCAAVQTNVVCWAAFTPTRSRLEELLSSRVRFKGESTMPLVPSDLISK